MREKLWVIAVEPEYGYGAPYLFIYHNGEHAMAKFEELVKKHNLDIVGLLGNSAIAATTGNHNHISRIDLTPEYTMD